MFLIEFILWSFHIKKKLMLPWLCCIQEWMQHYILLLELNCNKPLGWYKHKIHLEIHLKGLLLSSFPRYSAHKYLNDFVIIKKSTITFQSWGYALASIYLSVMDLTLIWVTATFLGTPGKDLLEALKLKHLTLGILEKHNL